MIECLSSSTPVARRRHVCSYCHAPIEKGERYCRSVNKFDYELYTWKAHVHCAHVAQAIWDWVGPDEGMDDYMFNECAKQAMHDLRDTTEFERGIRAAGSFIRRSLLVADEAPKFFADLDRRYYAGVQRGIIEAEKKSNQETGRPQ